MEYDGNMDTECINELYSFMDYKFEVKQVELDMECHR